MNREELLKSARSIGEELSAQFRGQSVRTLDRVQQNPEAARYFLAYADWQPATSEVIFSELYSATSARTQVYVDFPFCPVVCNFCAFYPVIARNQGQLEQYVSSLGKEVALLRKNYFTESRRADSLELGGGTPTFLPLELLKRAVLTVLEAFPFLDGGERNCETTPDLIVGEDGRAKLRFLRDVGFDRLSIGAQSFDEKVLRAAHRSHSSQQIAEALKAARDSGFNRVNCDLLLGVLDQSLDSFLDSIETAVDAGFDIIEIYSMRFFDTKAPVPLMKTYLNEGQRFISSVEQLTGRIAADLYLRDAGFDACNGRTYFRPRSASDYYSEFYRGNFTGSNVLGVGRKSHSNLYPWQYANYRNLDKYYAALESGVLPIAAGVRLSSAAIVAKRLTGLLQMPDPFDHSTMFNGCDSSLASEFDKILDRLVECGLLVRSGKEYLKTRMGFFFIEEMLKIILDEVVSPFDANVDFLGRTQKAAV